MTWMRAAGIEEFDKKTGMEVNLSGTRIAIFRTKGKFFAIEALCRHQDGSLAPGKVDGEVVECPLHSWHYNVRTGELLDYLEGVKLKTYKIDLKGRDIFIDV